MDSNNIGLKYVAPGIGTITSNLLWVAGLVSLIKFRRKEARRKVKAGAEGINPFISLSQLTSAVNWL